MKIHFICRGNGFRSRIAETYLNSLKLNDFKAVSSGTVADKYRSENDPISRPAKYILNKHGLLEYAKKQCDQLTQLRLEPKATLVCMNQRVFDESKDLVALPSDVIVWSVDDVPEYFPVLPQNEEVDRYAEQVFQSIKNNVDTLIKQLQTS
jgi:protein-tyrosine-phosphatase